mmetsp:Transcript_19372/g.17181  ORF Transcript_19372/g.17181 Transcript_19372/m.17181 type:complete len:83 (+) Transcript_19372:148-396(+)
MFGLIKSWFKIYKAYSYRDGQIQDLKKQILQLKKYEEDASPERGNDHNPKSHSKIEELRMNILEKLERLTEDDEILYEAIKE